MFIQKKIYNLNKVDLIQWVETKICSYIFILKASQGKYILSLWLVGLKSETYYHQNEQKSRSR